MPVDSVQNYNITSNSGVFSHVLAGGMLGVAGGYAAKHLAPLNEKERANIPYRSIINVARKETNKKMVESYNSLNKRSEAQDTFVKMISDKEFKNSSKIIKDLESTKPEVAKEFKKIIKIADRTASATARQYTGAYHKFLKCMRPNTPFVMAGVAIGVLGGMLYNACCAHKNA